MATPRMRKRLVVSLCAIGLAVAGMAPSAAAQEDPLTLTGVEVSCSVGQNFPAVPPQIYFTSSGWEPGTTVTIEWGGDQTRDVVAVDVMEDGIGWIATFPAAFANTDSLPNSVWPTTVELTGTVAGGGAGQIESGILADPECAPVPELAVAFSCAQVPPLVEVATGPWGDEFDVMIRWGEPQEVVTDPSKPDHERVNLKPDEDGYVRHSFSNEIWPLEVEVLGTDPYNFIITQEFAEPECDDEPTTTTTTQPQPTTTQPQPTTTESQPTTTQSPPTKGEANSPQQVDAGGTVAFSGDGFAPGSAIELQLQSDSVVLGSILADADGTFETTITIPENTTPGTHTLVAIGVDSSDQPHSVSLPIEVLAVQTLPFTGLAGGIPIAAGGLLLVLLGAASLRAGRASNPEGTTQDQV